MYCPKCSSTNTKIVPNTNYYTCFGLTKKKEDGSFEQIETCGHTFDFITGSKLHCPMCREFQRFTEATDGEYLVCDICETPFTIKDDEVVQPYHNLTYPLRAKEEFYQRDILEPEDYSVPDYP